MNFDSLPVSKDQLIEMLERRGIIRFLCQSLQIECSRLLDLNLYDGMLELVLEAEEGHQVVVSILFDTQSVLDLLDSMDQHFSALYGPQEPEEDEIFQVEATLLDVEPE